jgi:hypothetical protein
VLACMTQERKAPGWEGWFTPARRIGIQRQRGQATLPNLELFSLELYSVSLSSEKKDDSVQPREVLMISRAASIPDAIAPWTVPM